MNAATRLGAYGLGIVLAFGAAFGIAGAIVPDSAVAAWTQESKASDHSSVNTKLSPVATNGLGLEANGYVLSPVSAPKVTGQPGTMSFKIHDETGTALTHYTTAHERDLHLIVTRIDGSNFRHVHPVLDQATGTWSIPWEWNQAGSYRVFADFTPAGSEALTLSRTVSVAGDLVPVTQQPSRVAQVAGFTVSVQGQLVAGSASNLTLNITRDGKPVTEVQPYLGAFGHLVALREGDLAYVHAHAEGQKPVPGDTAGPEISFSVKAPTAGTYLLYLDFKVENKVHTAQFVLDASRPDSTTSPGTTHLDGH